MQHLTEIGDRPKIAVLLPLCAFLLMSPSTPAAPALQQPARVHSPGSPIIATFRASNELLQAFPNTQVVAVLKNGKTVTVKSSSNPTEVQIETFGVIATQQEIGLGKTVAVSGTDRTQALYGVEDLAGEWYGFNDVERLAIRHLRNTADKSFDGYEYDVRVSWKAKNPTVPGFEITHSGGKGFFGEAFQVQLGPRLIGRQIAFVLESESGAPLPNAEQESVSLEVVGGSPRIARGGEEVILPDGTRIARCQLTGGTEQRFTIGGICQMTWAPDQRPAKIVLLRKAAAAPILSTSTAPPNAATVPAVRPVPASPTAPAVSAGPALARVHFPGIPIVTTFQSAGNFLQAFPGVQVVAVLKSGKSVTVRSRGNAGEVRIDAFGVEATPQEAARGRTVAISDVDKTPALWGVEDQDGEWYGFDDIERLVIKHFRNTAEKTFDGYEYDVRVEWKDKAPANAGFEISHALGKAFFGTAIQGQFGTRLIGRRIAFVLESPSGPPALHAEREKVSLVAGDAGSAPRTFSGGEEVILPDTTRIARCQLTGGTEERFAMDGNCATWTWSPDQGPAKIVLLGKDTNLTIFYDREGSTATPRIGSISVYLTKANGNLVQSPAQQGAGDSLTVKGTTTMTSAAISLSGDPNFEDLESVEVPLDGSKLKLLRRRPGVVLVLDASQRLIPIREQVLPQIIKAVEELAKSPIARKFTIAVAQEDGYEVIGDLGKMREFFAKYRIDGTSNPQPRQALPRAQSDALKYNQSFPAIKNRIVYILPSDPNNDAPWRGAPPFDESKIDFFVVEAGLNSGAQAWAGKFLETYFGGNFSSRYRFAKTPDDLSRAIVELATR